MGSNDVSFILLAILAGAVGLGVAIALIVVAVKVTGGLLSALGWLIKHIVRFVVHVLGDAVALEHGRALGHEPQRECERRARHAEVGHDEPDMRRGCRCHAAPHSRLRSHSSTTVPTASSDSAEQCSSVSRVVCHWG